jgi:DNA primase
VICFDGDRAGEAAAARAIDRILLHLREGHSFRFAFLPQGLDPDDLVRSGGPAAFTHCLKAAHPLIDIVWQRELSAQPIDTPERRAAFEARLEQLLGSIVNARVREHYRREVKSRLFALWRERPDRNGKAGSRRGWTPARRQPQQPAKSGPTPLPSSYGFAATVALALVNHPRLLDRFAEEVASLDIRDKPLAALLGFVASSIFEEADMTRERLIETVEASGHARLFGKLFRESPFSRLAFIQPDAPARDVEELFADLIYRFRALPSLSRELQEGADRLADISEAEFDRFAVLQQQVAGVGQDHAGERDAGERDAAKRFRETVARLKREHLQRGRRPERRN